MNVEKKIVLLLVFFIVGLRCFGQNQKTEIFGLSYQNNALKNGNESGENKHFEVFALVPFFQNSKNVLGSKIIYSRSEFAGLDSDLNRNLTSVDINLFWQRQLNDKNKLQLGVMYGAFSDFKDINKEDFRLRFAANFSHAYSDVLSLGAGLMYSKHFNSDMFIPFATVNYKLNSKLTIAGLYPIKPKVIYQINKQFRWITEGAGHAETFRLSRKDDKSSVVELTGWTLMSNIDYTFKKNHRFSVGLGYTLSQRIRLYENPKSFKTKLWNFDLTQKENPIVDKTFSGFRWGAGYNFVF